MKSVSGEGIAVKRSGFANKMLMRIWTKGFVEAESEKAKKICLCAVAQTGLELQGAYWKDTEGEKNQRKDCK